MPALSIASSAMALAIDGMDQAKFKLPRVKGRQSKLFQRLFRPRLHVAASWVHGESISFAISDEDCKKDSSAQCELVSRAIDGVLTRAGGLPHGLAVQQDNTAREGKNQYFMSYLALLPALGAFRWVVASHLRPGHSDWTLVHLAIVV